MSFRVLRTFFFVLTAGVFIACEDPPAVDERQPGREFSRAALAGTLQSPAIVEASGLAHSRRDADLLWAINDGGEEAVLHRLATDGSSLGAVRVEGADNQDWEDLASFRLDGEAWLLIADSGDNAGLRDHATLYIVPEPPDDAAVSPAWTVRYTYPDGPHDTEAVAVDAAGGRILVLTKRTTPPELHEIPLRPSPGAGVITSRKLVDLSSLPQRDDPELQGLAGAIPYNWQPTAMDLSDDGGALAILTYADVYYYPLRPGESLETALAREPAALGMPFVPVAEAVALSDGARSVFVTAEGRHAPLLRFDHR